VRRGRAKLCACSGATASARPRSEASIAEKKAAGVALVVVEQNLTFAERIADRYLVMDQGRSVLEGWPATVDRDRILAHLHV
jgi:ABC-type branched-subunit amino acid transport system ATPase component